MSTLGMAAGQAAQGIFGLALGEYNDRRQIKQQSRLNDEQIRASKIMTDYNYDKQLAMWDATNYKAQMEQLKKANLNPALLYGMGGGAGGSTNVNSSNTGGSNAPSGGGEALGMMGMGMNLQLIDAQKKVLESQADLNKAQAVKTAGVDTKLGEANIASLTQGVENQKAVELLTKVETSIKNLDLEVSSMTMDDRIDMVEFQAKKLGRELAILRNDATISEATVNEKIQIVKNELRNMILNGSLIKVNIEAGKAGIKLTNEQIQTEQKTRWKMVQDVLNRKHEIGVMLDEIILGYYRLNNEVERTDLEKKKLKVEQELREEGLNIDWESLRTHQVNEGIKRITDLIPSKK